MSETDLSAGPTPGGDLLRLDGDTSSLVIDARGPGMPLPVYWGGRLPREADLASLAAVCQRPVPIHHLDKDEPPSLLPETGFGHYGHPGVSGDRDRRDWATRFRLARVDRPSGDALHIRLVDPVAGLALDLEVAIDPASDVVSRRTRLTNLGDTPYRLAWLAAATVVLPADADEALVLDGRWSREFRECRVPLGPGGWVRENRRGRTSHAAFPGIAVGRHGFGEDVGRVVGLTLAWSGNSRLSVENGADGIRLLSAGALLDPGEVVLAPGADATTPWCHMVLAPDGLNGMSRRWHDFVRRTVIDWPSARPRPVLLNTWEAAYFDHDLPRLKSLADSAAALGVERFVLDDGWFGGAHTGRNDDTSSLGDWQTDRRKWPNGLAPLIEHVSELGMEFGLWVEPEMISPDSDLYRAHPDWVLNLDPLPRPTARNQLVLDLTRADVFEHVFRQMDVLLQDNPIAYLKWDHNRDLATVASEGVAVAGGQTEAVYALIDRLRLRHPTVEIESCAGGGGRVDFGILQRTHRFWTSDCNDALERVAIQAGFGRFLPPEVMGAHIGPSPSHTTGRRHDLGFRGLVAMFGHLGLELDPTQLATDERSELAGLIALHKRLRPLLHGGRAWRLSGLGADQVGQGVVSGDKDHAVYALYQVASQPTSIPGKVALPGLDPVKRYRIRFAWPLPPGAIADTPALTAMADEGLVLEGTALGQPILQLPCLWPETAVLLEATVV